MSKDCFIDDTKTIRTLPHPGGVRVELQLNPYDDNRTLPPNSVVALTVEADGAVQLTNWDGSSTNWDGFSTPCFLSFASPNGCRPEGRWSPLANLLLGMRGSLPGEIASECRDQYERKVLSIIAAGGAPADAAHPRGQLHYRQRGRNAKTLRSAAMLWNAMWRRALPFLNAEALRRTRSAGGGIPVYNALVRNPRLMDLARTAPGLLVLLAEFFFIEEVEAAAMLITADRVELREATSILLRQVRAPGRDFAIPPGFMVWLQRARHVPSHNPFYGKNARTFGNLLEYGDDLDPNRIASIEGADGWYAFHFVANYCPGLLPAFLTNWEAATRALQRASEKRDDPRKLSRYKAVMDEVVDTIQASKSGAYPRAVGRNQSLARLLQESARYHGELRRRANEERVQLERIALLPEEERMEAYSALRGNDPASAQVLERRTLQFPEPVLVRAENSKYRMEWIPNGLALEYEGNVMGHCVATRAFGCAGGVSVIYRVASVVDNRSVATVEFAPSGKITELKGPNNRSVPQDLRRWVAAQVSKGAPNGLFGAQVEATDDIPTQPEPLTRVEYREPFVTRFETAEWYAEWIGDNIDLRTESQFMGVLLGRDRMEIRLGHRAAYRVRRKRDGFPLALAVAYPDCSVDAQGIRGTRVADRLHASLRAELRNAAPNGLFVSAAQAAEPSVSRAPLLLDGVPRDYTRSSHIPGAHSGESVGALIIGGVEYPARQPTCDCAV